MALHGHDPDARGSGDVFVHDGDRVGPSAQALRLRDELLKKAIGRG